MVPRSTDCLAALTAALLLILSGAAHAIDNDPTQPSLEEGPPAAKSDACLSSAEIARWPDPDFARNRSALQDPVLCVQIVKFTENGLRWTLEVIIHRKHPGPLWAVPHDNENAAFDTAVFAVRRYGGVVVAVEANERRHNGGQDPNRNFGNGRASGACPLQRAPAPRYTREFMSRAEPRFPIVALHTNSGGGNIDIGRPGAGNGSFLSAVASRLGFGASNTLVFIAGREPRDSPQAKRRAEALTARGLQVIYEHVTEARNDCSLSNYVALRTNHLYFNLEVGTGRGVTQRRMLAAVMALARISAVSSDPP